MGINLLGSLIVGSISPTSADRFLLWFIWLNEPLINGRFFLVPPFKYRKAISH
jgi:hypothetical protein